MINLYIYELTIDMSFHVCFTEITLIFLLTRRINDDYFISYLSSFHFSRIESCTIL